MTDLRTLFQDIFSDYFLPDSLANDLAEECDTIPNAYQHLEPRPNYVQTGGTCYGLTYRKRARKAIRESLPRHDYTRQFALVGCSSSKNPGYLPAREKYDADASPYWKWKRAYAETVADRYWILSAKHRLLHPTQYIRDYDRSLSKMDDEETDEWSTEVANGLEWDLTFWQKHFDGKQKERYYEEIVVLAGQSYVNPIRDALEGLPIDVRYPFENDDGTPRFDGIGEQTSLLKDRVQESHSERRTYDVSGKQSTVHAFSQEETA